MRNVGLTFTVVTHPESIYELRVNGVTVDWHLTAEAAGIRIETVKSLMTQTDDGGIVTRLTHFIRYEFENVLLVGYQFSRWISRMVRRELLPVLRDPGVLWLSGCVCLFAWVVLV